MKIFFLPITLVLFFTFSPISSAHWANEKNSSCQSNHPEFFSAFSPGLLKNYGKKTLLHSFQEMELFFGSCIGLEPQKEGQYLLKFEEANVPVELTWSKKKQIDKILLFKAEFPNDSLATVEARLEKLYPNQFSALVQRLNGKNAYAKNEELKLKIGDVQELFLLEQLGKDLETDLVSQALLDKDEKAMKLLEEAFFQKEKKKYKKVDSANVLQLCQTLLSLRENGVLKKIPSILAPQGWKSIVADSAWAPSLRQATEILQNESGEAYCFSFTVNSSKKLLIERTQELFFRWFRMISKEKL